MLMMGGQVASMRKHPHGRVDQLEDRYLGMVEAPSSNLGTSTRNDSKKFCWTVRRKEHQFQTISLLARHVHHLRRQEAIYITLSRWIHVFITVKVEQSIGK